MQLTRQAHAKINLDLRVLSVRPDGYHELSTVYQTLELHDTLRFESTDQHERLALTCTDPGVPTDERNLVWRAGAALWDAAGRDGPPRGARIDIVKRIPAQGGLGGGSADAAVALAALAELWGLGFDAAALIELGAGLGADVPFFLIGGTARGTGRGDSLECWSDQLDLEVVLAAPPFGVPTADAYRWFDEEGRPAASPGAPPGARVPWERWLSSCRNDLETPVLRRHPALGLARTRLAAGGAVLARMSGSGSTVYGMFVSAEAADRAAASLTGLDFRVLRTKTLARGPYLRAALDAGEGWLPAGSGIV